MNSETRTRSIVKTVTYRIVIAALLALITLYFTGNPGTTTIITVVFNLGGAAVYYGFERLWDVINWGKTSNPSLKSTQSTLRSSGMRPPEAIIVQDLISKSQPQ